MSLSSKQHLFAKDVAILFSFIIAEQWKFTIGEVKRTEYQQQKYLKEDKAQTMDSSHIRKMAIDINFFKPGKIHPDKYKLTYKKEELQLFGDFWESLNPKNEWGGNWIQFQDTPHFQRNL